MKPISKPLELFAQLARESDPIAFMVLFASDLRSTFGRLNAGASSREEAGNLLRSFARRLFGDVRTMRQDADPSEWYAEEEKRYLSRFVGSPVEKVDPSLESDWTILVARLKLILQSEYGKRRRAERKRTLINKVFHSRPVQIVLVSLVVVCLAMAAAAWYAISRHVVINLSVQGDFGSKVMVIAAPTVGFLLPGTVDSAPLHDSGEANDTVVTDTMRPTLTDTVATLSTLPPLPKPTAAALPSAPVVPRPASPPSADTSRTSLGSVPVPAQTGQVTQPVGPVKSAPSLPSDTSQSISR